MTKFHGTAETTNWMCNFTQFNGYFLHQLRNCEFYQRLMLTESNFTRKFLMIPYSYWRQLSPLLNVKNKISQTLSDYVQNYILWPSWDATCTFNAIFNMIKQWYSRTATYNSDDIQQCSRTKTPLLSITRRVSWLNLASSSSMIDNWGIEPPTQGRFTVVSRMVTFPDVFFPERRFPDGHFPGKTFPGWSFSRIRKFLMINLQAHT